MTSMQSSKRRDTMALYRVVVSFILIGLIFSFCAPLIYVGGYPDEAWHPGPPAYRLLFHAIQTPIGCVPAAITLVANVLVVKALLASLGPNSVASVLAMYGFVVFTTACAFATAVVLGIMFAFLLLGAWLPGPGFYFWLASVFAAFLAVGFSARQA